MHVCMCLSQPFQNKPSKHSKSKLTPQLRSVIGFLFKYFHYILGTINSHIVCFFRCIKMPIEDDQHTAAFLGKPLKLCSLY